MRTKIETDEQGIVQARRDRDDYYLALISGNDRKCYAIEDSYGLLGYQPELVSVGLNAAAVGKDPEEVIESYIVGRMIGTN
jgi:hypothetical protein